MTARGGLFFPDAMSELAFDPRAYDFDHPANKRPNYHFGEWDPHCIDNKGVIAGLSSAKSRSRRCSIASASQQTSHPATN